MKDNSIKFEIPVEGAITRFYNHLDTHDRTILSAKFGDGKSFFLQKFINDEDIKKEYVFLTLYPVNYQVEENRDVFELIKYDLLIQMFVKGILQPDFKMTNAQALGWCLQLNSPTLVEGLLPIYASLCLDPVSAKLVAAFLKAHKAIGLFKKKVDNFTESLRDRQIDKFLKEISKNPVSGYDVITEIIQKGLFDYKKEYIGKKIVLVIEDMDRMDPGHLFRILNVFSAHIDYNYRFSIEDDTPFIGNKFGLDKVVFVMSYNNTEHIFHHIYGAGAEFSGYIHKFCSSNYFEYSFSEEKENYLYDRMAINTGVDSNTLRFLVKKTDLDNHSIREIINAIEDVDRFIIEKPQIEMNARVHGEIHLGALKVIAILRKLGMKDGEIKERLISCMAKKDTSKHVFAYLASLLLYAKRGTVVGRVQYRDQYGSEPSIVEVQEVDRNGKSLCALYYDSGINKYASEDFLLVLDKLLSMVSV